MVVLIMKIEPLLKFTSTIFLIFFVCGCERESLNKLPSDATILAFGDSLTVGVGASSEESYPSALAEISGFNVIASGVSGETTGQGLARLGAALEKHDPDLLILLEGGNDILQNVGAEKTKQNLAAMIALSKGHGAEVLLIGVPEKGLFSRAAPLYEDLAEEHNIPLLSNTIGELLRDIKYKSDPIHLNGAGYALLAAAIYERLWEEGAL